MTVMIKAWFFSRSTVVYRSRRLRAASDAPINYAMILIPSGWICIVIQLFKLRCIKTHPICWYVCLFLMNWFSMNIRSKNPNTIFETPYFRRQYTSYFKQSRISWHNYTDVLVISSDVLGKHEFSSPAFSFVIRVSSLWSMWFHQFAMQCYNWFCSRPWWRDQMETFSALLAICAVNSPVNGEFHAQRPVTRSLDDLFDLRLNKRLSKQWWGGCFETLSCPLWRHCNAMLVGIHSERDVLLLHFGILYD